MPLEALLLLMSVSLNCEGIVGMDVFVFLLKRYRLDDYVSAVFRVERRCIVHVRKYQFSPEMEDSV